MIKKENREMTPGKAIEILKKLKPDSNLNLDKIAYTLDLLYLLAEIYFMEENKI